LGSIDLDLASCAVANKTVQAKTYFSVEDDGLKHDWYGTVWLNPPYSSDLLSRFVHKLVEHYLSGDVSQAVVLVNNATETKWFQKLVSIASAIVFTNGRIKFDTVEGRKGSPLQGQVLIYAGSHSERFLESF
jgi:phage N-6-adenine-methyltransferase